MTLKPTNKREKHNKVCYNFYFFLSQEDLAHGMTASVQCPEVDAVNAILLHSLVLILLYPQHTDGNAARPCASACCMWHFPKKGRRALILRADQVILCVRSSGTEDGRGWMMTLQPCTSSLFHAALVYKRPRWYSAKDRHTPVLLIPVPSPPCQSHAGLCKSFDMWLYCDREILQHKTAKAQIQP